MSNKIDQHNIYSLSLKAQKTNLLGNDIEIATQEILSTDLIDEKIFILKKWLSKKQPCLFGRLAANDESTLGVGICWITEQDISIGDEHVRTKIQEARRNWKNKAAAGQSHGFLLMYSSPEIAKIAPGPELVAIGTRMAELFLQEAGYINTDMIYTEAIPLKYKDGILRLHKGGVNMFYPTAHDTANHDRRIPGGILFSVNGPGHFAQSLVMRGLQKTMKDAIEFVFNLTVRSIGNGGIERDNKTTCTWHKQRQHVGNEEFDIELGKKLPHHVPHDFDRTTFAGNYHTDILIPRIVTEQANPNNTSHRWKNIYYDYFSDEPLPYYHPNFGWWQGMPVPDEAIHFNPWPPERPFDGDWDISPFWSKMHSLHPDI